MLEQKDCLLRIAGFLDILGCINFSLTSSSLHDLIFRSQMSTYHWQSFIESNYLETTLNMELLRRTIDYQCLMSKIISRLRYFHKISMAFGLNPIQARIYSASSQDRPEESPSNTLTPSICLQCIISSNTVVTDRMGLRLQELCGCTRGRTCYWSSAPFIGSTTRKRQPLEYLTIGLTSRLCCVRGYSITPYQAFFQNTAPIYGPKYVSLQLLLPSHSRTAAFSSQTSIKLQPVDSHEDLLESPDGVVYYESPVHAVTNTLQQHEFSLPRPVVALGGVVRLVFYGMHRRQTVFDDARQFISEADLAVMQGHYLCLGHVTIIGVDLEK